MGHPKSEVFAALERLAPLRLAESWDNVGLLVEPASHAPLCKALLTIDLTEAVLEEALAAEVDFVVAYHPPIFSGLRRLRASAHGERVVVRALAAGITIYSPHTALDAAVGGMTDWLALGCGAGRTTPIAASETDPGAGVGRVVSLDAALSLDAAVQRIKAHLGLGHLRLAAPDDVANFSARTVAFCPGAGGSVFEKVGQVDLLVTGEMRHHDVLSRVRRGTAVVLTDHTNTERGYLPILQKRLERECPDLEVLVSRVDRDPLAVV